MSTTARQTPAMPSPATNPAMLSPFHLAFPVHDLALARRFYGELLGSQVRRLRAAISV